ncbi:Histone chaperone asf1 [Microbotryomycetes sp. JL201]|nr:Histone chaperone asf1 [Microbotryomycetes sp. JL201]
MAPLEEDLEWKLTYVGSAESESYDQELDTCMVGPVPVGVNSFEFEASAPLPSRIPATELIGVTVILLTCSYNDQEFIRIGYYVNTEYSDPALKAQLEASMEEGAAEKGLVAPDPTQHIDKLVRSVLADKPRVTKYSVKWSVDTSAPVAGVAAAPAQQPTDTPVLGQPPAPAA